MKMVLDLLNWMILEKSTKGPTDTIKTALEKTGDISGKVIISDCDYSLDLKPMFEKR